MRILVTGGPVHAYLDPIKIITNRFKGGRMLALAGELKRMGHNVTYLTAKQTRPGSSDLAPYADGNSGSLQVVPHDGFDDYRQKVNQLAIAHDAVVLGAAVANLIPAEPMEKKFPSHDYKPGDRIDIPFTIAPRVIDEIRTNTPQMKNLFGFKLLQGVPHEELINAAYDIVLESRATAVFANDANDLDTVYAVTKERAIIPLERQFLPSFMDELLRDRYYRTVVVERGVKPINQDLLKIGKTLAELYADKFQKRYGAKEYVFGTIAIRSLSSNGLNFVTTARGKHELQDWVEVLQVDHAERTVYAARKAASLNAPLLARLFWDNPWANAIVHWHETGSGHPVVPWAPPGSVRDTHREGWLPPVFEIEHHGVFELLR